MKSLLIIIDGLGDDKISALGNKSPFDYAPHINIDNIAANGMRGKLSICERDFIPESLKCILRLLGVKSDDFPTNRAYLELLAEHRDISAQQMVLRCNLVSVDKTGKLLSFNGDGLTLKAMQDAAVQLGELSGAIDFVHLSGYRNLLIASKNTELLGQVIVKPPHESVGENINDLLSDLKKVSPNLQNFLVKAQDNLKNFAKNGEHYELYPWGVSERTTMQSFSQSHGGLKSAVICSAEVVKGIASSLNMECPKLLHATGEVDTDLKEKAFAAMNMLKTNDFVLIHFNGTDEAAHRKNYCEKASFITRIDKEFFPVLLKNIQEPTKVFICGDHGTSSLTGKHLASPVPFVAGIIAGSGVIKPIEKYQDIWSFLYERGNK